jgi:hypothetical protein
MMGYRPYVGRTRQEIKDNIEWKQVLIKSNQIPNGWSVEAADFINKVREKCLVKVKKLIFVDAVPHLD